MNVKNRCVGGRGFGLVTASQGTRRRAPVAGWQCEGKQDVPSAETSWGGCRSCRRRYRCRRRWCRRFCRRWGVRALRVVLSVCPSVRKWRASTPFCDTLRERLMGRRRQVANHRDKRGRRTAARPWHTLRRSPPVHCGTAVPPPPQKPSARLPACRIPYILAACPYRNKPKRQLS